MICKETELKIHKTIDDQMKDKSLCIQTQIAVRNESSFNVSCQLVTTLEKWLNWQTSAAVTIYNCWEWRKLVLCWLN